MTKRTREMLSIYLLGIAIGLFLLGFFFVGKRAAQRAQKANTPTNQQSAP